ncbi:hypothetical protein SDRG_08970 [Saprolegnia diclina VS20]|uniref:WRKY19-like zinc finger domain-containing protein n=1 Tax=Saprolegnia diclina (strain VS20) TaxID=1156394 RepID=T0Q6L8_SAPDV|nr:hypothetical protein SDRG_08970 [Saprolegnia diclina VS20]EQC33459.1 hypothetical protein SDRG_08970 [Saprolegnia diclina VS20]|eukprot:XP_008613099.1 hypothetical protein SDRG_08970 [Saprolegnia diclina VS20]
MTLAAPPAFGRPMLLPPLTSTLSPSIAEQMKQSRPLTPLAPFPYRGEPERSPVFTTPRHESTTVYALPPPFPHYEPSYASPAATPLAHRPRLPPASWLLQKPELRYEYAAPSPVHHAPPPPMFVAPPVTSPTHATIDEVRGECLDAQCHQPVKHRGYCKVHGGARRCDVPGCPKGVQGGNLCIGHGGGKRCRFPGCSKATQSQGLCKAHGGGVRCKFDGCNKSSQGGGFCRRHGGGKRCSVDGCPRGAQRGSTCAQHGGKAKCMVDGCVRADRGGGYCEVHRKDKVCRQGYCNRLARIKCEGYCTQHHRELCISNNESPAVC